MNSDIQDKELSFDDIPGDLWDKWQKVKQYQSNIGLTKNIPTFVDFMEGRQWAPPTEKTKSLPRPVVNITKMIVRNKTSSITSSKIKLIYKAEREDVDTQKFTNFSDYMMKEMGMDALDAKAVRDGGIKGSYFYHFYWDNEAKGKLGSKPGGTRCELIDIFDIGFSNPKETDEQKQKWIIIATREEVASVRAKMDKNDKDLDPDAISEDELNSAYGEVEQEGSKLVTVLTQYYRKNGEVYCVRATKNALVTKPFPISPDVEKATQILTEDAPNSDLTDDSKRESLPRGKAYLYPVVVGNYEEREKCIYGIGEVEGIIPNQKAINHNLGMMLLAAQNTAWDKYVVSEDALQGQEITNEPGQVLTDYSKTGKGISKLGGSTSQSMNIQLVNILADLTRVVTGSTEVMTGEAISANMSGAAIAQLQSQAQQPIEELRERFWRVKEKQGKVLEQFYKLFYYKKEFVYPEVQKTKNNAGEIEEKEVNIPDMFSGEDYRDVEFSIVVEATAGTRSSAAGDINMLDNLLAKQMIDKKTYIKAYPKNAINNKTEILKAMEDEENSQIKQLTMQIQQKDEQLKQSTELLAKQKEIVDKVVKVIQENNQLRGILAQLYDESKNKINQGNEAIKQLKAQLLSTHADATDFARELLNSGYQTGNT